MQRLGKTRSAVGKFAERDCGAIFSPFSFFLFFLHSVGSLKSVGKRVSRFASPVIADLRAVSRARVTKTQDISPKESIARAESNHPLYDSRKFLRPSANLPRSARAIPKSFATSTRISRSPSCENFIRAIVVVDNDGRIQRSSARE